MHISMCPGLRFGQHTPDTFVENIQSVLVNIMQKD